MGMGPVIREFFEPTRTTSPVKSAHARSCFSYLTMLRHSVRIERSAAPAVQALLASDKPEISSAVRMNESDANLMFRNQDCCVSGSAGTAMFRQGNLVRNGWLLMPRRAKIILRPPLPKLLSLVFPGAT